MTTYNLPPVDFTTLAPPTEAGSWTGARRLDDLAKALRVAETKVAIDDIKSIPDPWAQPLVFGQALVDPPRDGRGGHELHASVVAQWRAMLALFGLQGHMQQHYQLRIVPIDLTSTGEGSASFRNMLRALLPTDSLARGSASWSRLGMVTFQTLGKEEFDHGEPQNLGMLSPTSLVAVGKAGARITCDAVPWLRGGMQDPLECDDIPAAHWRALAAFAMQILQYFRNRRTEFPSPELQPVLDAIKEFGSLCRDRGMLSADTGIRTAPVELPDPVPSPLYEPLRISQKWSDERPKVGETQIQLPELAIGGEALVSGVLLVDPEIARALKAPAQNIYVWKGHSLQDLEQPHLLRQARQEASAEGYVLLTPDDLFTAKLTQIEGQPDIPGNGAAFRNRLLPISPIVLLLMSADEIRQRLEIVDRGGHFEVSLGVDLAGAPGEPTTRHRLVRTYSKGDLVKVQPPTDLALWPNFSRDDWHWDFLRFQYNPGLQLRTRFGLSSRGLAEMIAATGAGAARRSVNYLKWGMSQMLAPEEELVHFKSGIGEARSSDGRQVFHRVRFAEDPQLIGEQHLMPFGADAVFFASIPDQNGKVYPAGCVLVQRTPAPTAHGNVEVSIDFGTTSTVVYMKRDDAVEPVGFRSRVVVPIPLSGSTINDLLIAEYTDFLPMHDQGTPFPTVVKKRMFKGPLPEPMQRTRGMSDDPGVSDNIFFMPQSLAVGMAYGLMQDRQLIFQLKWSREPDERRMVQRFLRQAMMMVSAEAVTKGILPQHITWHFSYPQAFSLQEKRGLTGFVHNAWTDLFGAMQSENRPLSDLLKFETEGAAALRLFAGNAGRFANRAGRVLIMLDIGGGTSEIALHRDRKTLWRSSVKIAGGAFFTTFIANNLDLVDKLNVPGVQDIRLFATDRRSASDAVELLVSRQDFDAAFKRSFEAIRDTDEGAGLVASASVALGSLLYYSGIAARTIIAEDERDLPAADLGDLTLAFAGRGSSIFKDMGPASDPRSELAQLCQLFSKAALAKPAEGEAVAEPPPAKGKAPKADRVRVTSLFSDMPKHEVAEGLLSDPLAQDEEGVAYRMLPAGLGALLDSGSGQVAMASTDDVSILLRATDLAAIDLGELDNFLRLLRDHVGIHIDIDHAGGEARRRVENSVRGSLLESIRSVAGDNPDERDPETEEFEPPFISAVRALLGMLSLPMAERDKLLRVRRVEPSS